MIAGVARSATSRKTTVSMTPVRRALSLILQYPQLVAEFYVLESIAEDHVRGIKMVQALVAACKDGEQLSTASLLERYRQESFFQTLSQLANHQHNNIESLSKDEAITLINANNAKIVEQAKELELSLATNELTDLGKKKAIAELNAEEDKRMKQLKDLIRESYK